MILMQEMLLFFQTALHRPVVSPANEAAENAVEVSHIVGAAKLAVYMITVEAANEPAVNVEAVVKRLLRDIFESEEPAQRDPEPEQLKEIFEFEEAAQMQGVPRNMTVGEWF